MSLSRRSGNVRESQGERFPFHFGQGMSGKVRGKGVLFTLVRECQGESGGKVSFSLWSGNVRESQGERCPFHFGQGMSGRVRGKGVLFTLVRECQGKSGKLAMVRGKSTFVVLVREGMSFFITTVFDLFILQLKFMVLFCLHVCTLAIPKAIWIILPFTVPNQKYC